jgi:ribosome biogenesis GTPase
LTLDAEPAADRPGRVVARFGQRYIVALEAGAGTAAAEVDAVVRGRRNDVVVGDRVRLQQERELAVIQSVVPRRNLLFRSDGARVKPLAANVDQVAIVFAIRPAPQEEFVWRALLAARSAGIEALAIHNKIDLDGAPAQAILDGVAAWGVRGLRVSARADPEGTRAQLRAACAGRSTLFVGQSGMGKSSLLNLLIDVQVRTGALSRSGSHGRQTTTATRWFDDGEGRAVIDSPGFQEFGLAHIASDELLALLPDFAAIEGSCRFANCRHVEEPGCRIREAVARGAIRPERYEFFRKLCAGEQDRRRNERGY